MNEVITWALKQQLPPGTAAAKHVLTIIGNQANLDPDRRGDVIAYPSIDYLVWATGQNRKTVIANMKRLQEWGLIVDTGRRVGRTRQVIVYKINCGPDLFTEQSQNRNGSKTGTVKRAAKTAEPAGKESQNRNGTDIGTVPDLDGKGTDIGRKESQYWDTEPSLTQRNQVGGDAQARASDVDARIEREEQYNALVGTDQNLIDPYLPDLPLGIDLEVFVGFVKHRHVSRRVLSIFAWKQLVAELKRLETDGVDLNESLKATARLGLSSPIDPRGTDGRSSGNRGPPRPRANDDFSNVRYEGTPDDELPPELRNP